jgi:hypothetical protein
MAVVRIWVWVTVLATVLAVPGWASTILPDLPFIVDFSIASLPFPNTPDELDVLIVGSGSFHPFGASSAVTAKVYDGATLLGSDRTSPAAGAFSGLWLASFFASANPFGAPTIDFRSIAKRTIHGKLEITVTGASLTIDHLTALKMDIAYPVSPSASDGYLISGIARDGPLPEAPEPGYGALAIGAGLGMIGWRRVRSR